MNIKKLAGLGLLAALTMSCEPAVTTGACQVKPAPSCLGPKPHPRNEGDSRGERRNSNGKERSTKAWKNGKNPHQTLDGVDKEGNVHQKHRWVDNKGNNHETDHWNDKANNVHQCHRWVDSEKTIHQTRHITDKDGKVAFHHFKKDKNGVVTKQERGRGCGRKNKSVSKGRSQDSKGKRRGEKSVSVGKGGDKDNNGKRDRSAGKRDDKDGKCQSVLAGVNRCDREAFRDGKKIQFGSKNEDSYKLLVKAGGVQHASGCPNLKTNY